MSNLVRRGIIHSSLCLSIWGDFFYLLMVGSVDILKCEVFFIVFGYVLTVIFFLL